MSRDGALAWAHAWVGDTDVLARVTTRTPSHLCPIVAVHGLGVSSRYFVPTLRALAPHFRCFAPDLPGFGRTRAKGVLGFDALVEVLERWMDAIRLPRAAFVANSMGCQLVAALAVRAPERVIAAVLNGPTFDAHRRGVLRQLWGWAATGPFERPGLYPVLAREYASAGAVRTVRTFLDALHRPIEDDLRRVRCPVLVVRGSRDRAVSERWAREVAALCPDGRFAEVPGAAHAVNFSSPLELGRLTRLFVEDATSGMPPFAPAGAQLERAVGAHLGWTGPS